MRTFVIGDIHGCFDELMQLTQKIGLTENDMLISVGDIVDRGNKSKAVYEYFLNRPNSIVLVGNHERKHQNRILSYSQEIVKLQFGADYEGFLKWIRSLDYYYETEDALIVHAFFEHDKELKEQKQEILCGSTSGTRYLEKKYAPETFWAEYYQGSKPIIYGHHVVGNSPKILNNTYGLDTGCCHGDYLTALELPTFKIHQVKAKRDYWKEEQRLWQIPVLKAKDWNNTQFADIDKQLHKLAYIQEAALVNYLSEIGIWKEELVNSYGDIQLKIDKLCKSLMEEHKDNFSVEANKFPFKAYLFKSKTDSLTIEYLEKNLNTPNKVIELKSQMATFNL
jgi:serine/threonine protein phosphatase 1